MTTSAFRTAMQDFSWLARARYQAGSPYHDYDTLVPAPKRTKHPTTSNREVTPSTAARQTTSPLIDDERLKHITRWTRAPDLTRFAEQSPVRHQMSQMSDLDSFLNRLANPVKLNSAFQVEINHVTISYYPSPEPHLIFSVRTPSGIKTNELESTLPWLREIAAVYKRLKSQNLVSNHSHDKSGIPIRLDIPESLWEAAEFTYQAFDASLLRQRHRAYIVLKDKAEANRSEYTQHVIPIVRAANAALQLINPFYELLLRADDESLDRHVRFLGDVHDFRNAISGILNASEAFWRPRFLVHNTIDRLHFLFPPLNIKYLIRNICCNVSYAYNDAPVQIIIDLPPEIAKIQIANRDQFRILDSIIRNPVSNGVKYRAHRADDEQSCVLIRITLLDDGVLSIHVIDNGRGMSASDLKKYGQPGWRSEDVVEDGIAGNGLGVSSALDLIRTQGGTYTIDSELDVGTIFTATLPMPS